MQKNFATYRQTISEFVGVSEAAAVAAPPAAEAAAAAATAAVPVPVAAEAAAPAGLLESLAGRELVARLDPWAAFLSARLAGLVPPPLTLMAEQGTLLVLLAGGLLLLGMRLVVDVLRFMRHAGDNPQDGIALLAHLAFRVRPTDWRLCGRRSSSASHAWSCCSLDATPPHERSCP